MDNDGIATRSVYKKHVHQQQDQETRGLGMSYTLTSTSPSSTTAMLTSSALDDSATKTNKQ